MVSETRPSARFFVLAPNFLELVLSVSDLYHFGHDGYTDFLRGLSSDGKADWRMHPLKVLSR